MICHLSVLLPWQAIEHSSGPIHSLSFQPDKRVLLAGGTGYVFMYRVISNAEYRRAPDSFIQDLTRGRLHTDFLISKSSYGQALFKSSHEPRPSTLLLKTSKPPLRRRDFQPTSGAVGSTQSHTGQTQVENVEVIKLIMPIMECHTDIVRGIENNGLGRVFSSSFDSRIVLFDLDRPRDSKRPFQGGHKCHSVSLVLLFGLDGRLRPRPSCLGVAG